VRPVRRNRDDRAFEQGRPEISLPDFHIVRTPIDTIDNEVMPVVQFVAEIARDNLSDQPRRVRVRRIVDRIISNVMRRRLLSQRMMHGLDDVAAFAHALKN